jgi:glycosyltransferase involved in cell wall biosynthesis
MRIGIDGQPLSQAWTGIGHYTFELACALARLDTQNEFELISPRPFADQTAAVEKNLPPNLRLVHLSTNFITRRWFAFGLPRHLARHNIELFHGTNYEIPLVGRCPSVLTIHDLSLFTHSETHLSSRVRRARARLPLLIRRAACITTETETMRAMICERFKAAREKVMVVPAAPRRIFRPAADDEIDAELLRAKFGINERFLLYVGTIEPRKNLATLLDAFEALMRDQAKEDSLQLVVAGARGWLHRDFFARIENSPLKKSLIITDYLTDEELRALYATCELFIYPSLDEGFGLPPLEAMACGAPVIASDIAVLRETLDCAAAFFPPTDARALAETIGSLLVNQDARQQLIEKGRARAAAFTWKRAAALMSAVYAQAAPLK